VLSWIESSLPLPHLEAQQVVDGLVGAVLTLLHLAIKLLERQVARGAWPAEAGGQGEGGTADLPLSEVTGGQRPRRQDLHTAVRGVTISG